MKIFEALKSVVSEYISDVQRIVMREDDDSVLLKTYIQEWMKFFAQCQYIAQPFKSLETHTAKNNSGKKNKPAVAESSSIKKLMLDTWNEIIFSNINYKLQASAMKLIHDERAGESFDSQLVIGVRESYVNLCYSEDDKLRIYRSNFEKAYLEATRQFYSNVASQYLEENGVEKYMNYAHSKLQEEEHRAQRYLGTSQGCNSCELLIQVCVDVLVSDVKDCILEECPGFIAVNHTEKLLKMFHLMDRVSDGVQPMISHLESHVITTGLADMIGAAATISTDSEKYVDRLLMLFNRYSALVKEAFDDDPRFLTARDKSFKKVVNDTSIFNLELATNIKSSASKTVPESKCPELLANFCDMLLRKSPYSKKLTSDEIEAKLKDVLLVLKYVDNKDVFMRYHKAHLTRRLILDCSTDSDLEENVVEWLRDVGMPADYINKLARMFQDIKLSEDLNQAFKDVYRARSAMADSVAIKILNAGAWARSSERVAVSLPTVLEDFIPEVEEFYLRIHSGRKLQWIHLMSNGVITFATKQGKYDIEVTTFQMAVLFAWNERRNDKLSFNDLRLATELPESELRRTLWSLIAFPKLKRQILICEPAVQSPKEFRKDSTFYVNHDFALIKNGKVQKRGKINFIGRLQLSTDKHREEDNEAIVALRILRTQEGIVRIMKMRKTISNAQLQTELVEILKNMFIPQKKMIKEQIEWLIEHKYIKRDENNINQFIYLA
ncbi:cullin-5 [Paramuricea clavata]|uniref:Cullin-5 n=1 Tax=Paramuricea clavata TaxID=317549 RepID=A0A7D9HYB9_PARCT|nr:cullin-5 [Paramuricea clavata]